MKKSVSVLFLILFLFVFGSCKNDVKDAVVLQTVSINSEKVSEFKLIDLINISVEDAKKELQSQDMEFYYIESNPFQTKQEATDSFWNSERFQFFKADFPSNTLPIGISGKMEFCDGWLLSIKNMVYAFYGFTSSESCNNVQDLLKLIGYEKSDVSPMLETSDDLKDDFYIITLEDDELKIQIKAFKHNTDNWKEFWPMDFSIYYDYRAIMYSQGDKEFEKKAYIASMEYFDLAGAYKDASEKYKISCYNIGLEAEKDKDYDSALKFFKLAQNYQDSKNKCYDACYHIGIQAESEKNYKKAIDMFSSIQGYKDSEDKYTEMCYLYGKNLLDLNNETDGLAYLEKCVGYKDTDEIVTPYYYKYAIEEKDRYLTLCGESVGVYDAYEYSDAYKSYEKAISFFNKCKTYKDSSIWLSSLNTINDVCKMSNKVNAKFTDNQNYGIRFDEFIPIIEENSIIISDGYYNSGSSTSATVKFSYEKNSFYANISSVYFSNMSDEDRDSIRLIVMLFTEIEEDDVLCDWLIKNFDTYNSEITKSINYGGYSITISTRPTEYHHIGITISGEKNNYIK